jgi:hypothetical protein
MNSKRGVCAIFFFGLIASLVGSVNASPEFSFWYDDPLLQYIWEFDLLGFVFACYYSIIGPLALGLPTMFLSVVLYIRQKSLLIVSIVWMLIGASMVAGMVELAPVAVLFSALGIAGVLAQLVLSWRER